MLQQAPVAERPSLPAVEIEALQSAFHPTATRYRPEDSPFSTLFADITHRCNMACRNCYIPVRDLPDLPADWLYAVLKRLPRRVRLRLVGAEPTMREDLPEIIARVRQLGHLPVVLTNGLKLGRASYARKLRDAGLRSIYISMNGGLRDELYEAIDDLACAARKLAALDNLLALRMNVTPGMILVRGVNEQHLPEFLSYLVDRGVHDLHLRSVGAIGHHLEGRPFSLDELEHLLRDALGPRATELRCVGAERSSRDFRCGQLEYQITEWPDLGSRERGRITPDGFVEPFFESILANEFKY